MTDLIFLIDDYIMEIKESDLYNNYLIYSKKVNELYHLEFKELNNLNEKFNEVMKYGKYHPDFKDISKKYRDQRIKYYNFEEVILLKKYSKQLDEKISAFFNKLTKKISVHIPIFNELGMIESTTGGLSCGHK